MPGVLATLRRLAGSFWIRLLVSAGLLAIVATQIDFHALRERLSGGSWGWFAAAVAVLFASFVVGALRWHIFLAAAEVGSSRGQAIRAYLIGAFTTNFLPSQIGGDVTRAWVASEQGTRIRSATTVVLDRATALACLMIVGWIGVAANVGAVPGQLSRRSARPALPTCSPAFSPFFSSAFARFGGCYLSGRFRPREKCAERSWRASRGCPLEDARDRSRVPGPRVPGAWLIALSISLDVPFAVLGAVLAPVLILSTAPVSIGGFGVREGSYVLLLSYAGVSATDATLFSLLSAAAFALASLPGALALLVGRRPASSSA